MPVIRAANVKGFEYSSFTKTVFFHQHQKNIFHDVLPVSECSTFIKVMLYFN